MDLLLTKQKYFLFISRNGEINVELKNILLNSLKAEEKYSFFIQLY